MTSGELIKNLDPTKLTTEQECIEALWLLEEAIAKIETQLMYAEHEKQEIGWYRDARWVLSAKAALAIDKAKKRVLLRQYETIQAANERSIDLLINAIGEDRAATILATV